MGRRSRQRAKLADRSLDSDARRAPVSEYPDADGSVLALRGALSPATRREYAGVLEGGLSREDARQRAIELLFERLAVSWTIAGVTTDRQQELIGRYRMASASERASVLEALRAHAAEHFGELEIP